MRSSRTSHPPIRATVTAAVAAIALALSSAGLVVAQEGATASPVTTSISDCLTVAIGTITSGPGGSEATVNQVWKCRIDADDERLGGELDLVYNVLGWSGTGAIQWGWAQISNEGGTWDGVWSSTVRDDGEQVILAWYQGSGDHAGWSYTETQLGDYQQPREGFGIVYPGDPPPSVVITPPERVDVDVAE